MMLNAGCMTRKEGESCLMQQPQPGCLVAEGNYQAMFIATQFVKPTLHGNNARSLLFLSLFHISSHSLSFALSLPFCLSML